MNPLLTGSVAASMDDKGRIGGMDIAKGIAIIAVVVGHYLQNYHTAYMDYAFCFHVSLFFILSGYFLNVNGEAKIFVRNKMKRLLKPYFITGGIWCVLMTMKEMIKEGVPVAAKQLLKCVYAILWGGGQGKGSFYLTLSLEWKSIGCEVGMLWFLLALLWGSIIVYLVYKLKSRIVRIIAVLGVVVIGYLSSRLIILPWSVQQGMFSTGFIYFGVYARRRNFYNTIKKNWKYIVISIAGISLLFAMGRYSMFKMYSNYCEHGVADYIAALIISCSVIILSSYLYESRADKLKKLLSWIGQNSLLILCIHFLDVRLFGFAVKKLLNFTMMSEFIIMPLSLVVSVGLYCFVIWAMNKMNYERKIIT